MSDEPAFIGDRRRVCGDGAGTVPYREVIVSRPTLGRS
jgi:hypothetical protein